MRQHNSYRASNAPQLDAQDEAIVAARVVALDAEPEPRCGDYVDFADGVTRRISHVYGSDWDEMSGVQTSDGGSWYLGTGWVSFSGSLHPSVKMSTLTLTDEKRKGVVWIFHHNWQTAGGGVDAVIEFRVYKCSVDAPR